MTTSNSTDFNLTATEIISDAMDIIGVKASEETPSNDELQTGLRVLNMMLKGWQVDGPHLWVHTEAALFLVEGQASYNLPGANVAKLSTLTETALAADASASDTSLSVDSITGIADTETIGIVLDDDTIHWTTVSGSPTGSSVTLTTGLASAASDGNAVWVYSSTIERPNRITGIRRHRNGIETPMLLVGRKDYFMLPTKESTGIPTQAYYDPQTTTGVLYTWPTADTVDDHIRFTYTRPFQDLDNLTNNLDFPTEWLEAIEHNLAVRWAPRFGVRPTPETVALATNTLEALRGWDRELESVQFEPETR